MSPTAQILTNKTSLSPSLLETYNSICKLINEIPSYFDGKASKDFANKVYLLIENLDIRTFNSYILKNNTNNINTEDLEKQTVANCNELLRKSAMLYTGAISWRNIPGLENDFSHHPERKNELLFLLVNLAHAPAAYLGNTDYLSAALEVAKQETNPTHYYPAIKILLNHISLCRSVPRSLRSHADHYEQASILTFITVREDLEMSHLESLKKTTYQILAYEIARSLRIENLEFNTLTHQFDINEKQASKIESHFNIHILTDTVAATIKSLLNGQLVHPETVPIYKLAQYLYESI